MKFKPIEDNVVIRLAKPPKRETQTKSGLYTVNAQKPNRGEGEIVAVGEGRVLKDGSRVVPEIKVGDRVFFDDNHSVRIVVDGESFMMTKEEFVLAIIE